MVQKFTNASRAHIITSNSRLASFNIAREAKIDALEFAKRASVTKNTSTAVEVKIPSKLFQGDRLKRGDLFLTIEMVEEDIVGLTYRLVSR